ncbi:MAG: hypothetical protein H6717_42050 [Polyangiaceae bacterium]|nr:hypothetical protein [Polyangiaceae bacterium]
MHHAVIRALAVSTASVVLALAAVWSCSKEHDQTGPQSGGAAGASGSADATPDWGVGGSSWEASSGGSGGSSPTDSGLPSDLAWLADPDIWKPVPGTDFLAPYCAAFEGVPALLKFPALEWKGCGTGCAVADLVQGYQKAGAYRGAGTHIVEGKTRALLALHTVTTTDSHYYQTARVADLETGTTIGAVELVEKTGIAWATCSVGQGPESAVIGGVAGLSIPGDPESHSLAMTLNVPEGTWIWAQPALENAPQGLMSFDIDSDNIRFQTGKGAVRALLNPAVSTWTTLESNSLSSIGSGQGDLAVWIDSVQPGKQKIRGWAPDGKGIRDLLDPAPALTCMVAPGPTAIVGAVSDGSSCSDYGHLRLFKLPRIYSLSASAPELSPTFGSTPLALYTEPGLRVWNGYAIATVSEPGEAGPGDAFLLVVRLSDWKSWRVDASPGHQPHGSAWTITDKYLYFGEAGTTAATSQWATQIRRYDLAELDQLATPLGN